MILLGSLLALAAAAGLLLWQIYRRSLHIWIVPYILEARERRLPAADEPVHLFLCVADHFEPRWGGASAALARQRVERWVREYPRRFADFCDSDGRPPQHTFFYPAEEYASDHIDALAELCRAGFGEVEIHLHHDRDTSDGLRTKLLDFKTVLSERHGLLSRHRTTGEVFFGFIHGNWALDNSRPDGRWCGVNNELDV